MAELRNEFSWSTSRDDTFRLCPRRYFYHYYGAWGGWDGKADPKTRTLYVLKQLQTRHQWIGGTVHNALRWVLDTLRQHGRLPDEEMTLRHLVNRLQRDFQESGEGVYWDKPKGTTGLVEHEYDDLEIDDGEWRDLFEKAATCVSVFYRGPIVRELVDLPADRWVEMEKLASFEIDGVRVWVQLDLAYRTDAGLRIVDWKTGRADQPATREQLALYTLYAADRWHAHADSIVATESNLATGDVIDHPVSADDLHTARTRVLESSAAMRALLDDDAANAASESRFAVTADDKPCRTCPFRRVCPKWADAV